MVVLALALGLFASACRKWDNPNDPTGNHAPAVPSSPSPDSGAVDRDTSIGLAWACSDPDTGDELTYSVYFGIGATRVLLDSELTEPSFDPGRLAFLTEYSWQVVARDNHGAETEGPVWSFSTVRENHAPAVPSNPVPDSGVTNHSLQAYLSWSAADPDSGDTMEYDVYFDTSDPPGLASQGQADTSYSLARLQYERTYYWRIVARDNHGAEALGPTWSFSTLEQVRVTKPDSASRKRIGQQDTIRWTGGPTAKTTKDEGRRTKSRGRRAGATGFGKSAPGRQPSAVSRLLSGADSTIIYYSTNNGSNWTRYGIAPVQGWHIWTVPGPSATSQARVQVRMYLGADTASGASGPFSIYDSMAPSGIVVTNPTTASRWEVGTEQPIQWTGGTDGYDSFAFYYSADSMQTWSRQGRSYTPGTYQWVVGAPASSRAYVEVRAYCGRYTTTGRSPKFQTTDPGYPDTVLATVTVGQHPLALCFDSLDNRIYVVLGGDTGKVAVLDCNTNQVAALINVGSSPSAAAWNGTNNLIYVANQNDNSVSVIAASTNQVITTIPVGSGPAALYWDPDQNKVFVLGKNDSSVTVISGSTNAVLATLGVRSTPLAMCLRRDRGWLYVGNSGGSTVTVISAERDSVMMQRPVGSGPLALVAEDEHKGVYVANSLANSVTFIDSTNTAQPAINVGQKPYALAWSPQSDKVLCVNNLGNSVSVISTNTRQVLTTVNVGSLPKAIVWATYTNRCYVPNYNTNTVSVIDVGASVVNKTLTVGTHPTAVAWNPRLKRVYVANYDGSSVSVLARRQY